MYAKSEILKIETIEPHDEGLYQCFARNDFGVEASGTYYLHLPPRNLLNYAPYNPKCHSMGDNTLMIEFQKREPEKVNRIQYFIATENPHDFITNFSTDLLGKNSFEITKSLMRIVKSLKPFHIFLRSMMPSGEALTTSTLSQPVMCAFQEIEPKFVKAQNGTFLTWKIDDLSHDELRDAIITIQFLKNGTSNVPFVNEVVGTYAEWGDHVLWTEVEKNLQRITVNNSDYGQWTEIKVQGNVTGILIIKVEEIFVRIFGSIPSEDGTHLQQDYSMLKWKSVKAQFVPITISSIESRSVTINWNGLENFGCLKACTFLKQETLMALRSPAKSKINCKKMWVRITKLKTKHFTFHWIHLYIIEN